MEVIKRLIASLLLLPFALTTVMPAALASEMPWMPQPGAQVSLTPAFTPAHLKGMVINPTDPFKFDFIVNRGDVTLTDAQKQTEYSKLVKYFLAALAVPDTEQWVNLSPYEKDRIIPDGFGLTEMGRDLLAQDYLLKQISASLTNPDTDLGKKFWDGVYAQAYEKYGTTDIPTDTINKVWITPDKAVVYEKGNSVIVVEQHLKVMLESDYKAMKANTGDEIAADNDAVKISKQVMREIIIPAIEKEVNEGKSFAPLRQVYSGMLLATWYKVALKESILGKLYADQGKVKGVDQDPKNNQQIYDQYVQAFKKGVFNMIKEDVDRYSQEVIPRKYFSGGAVNKYQEIIKRVKSGAGIQDLLPTGVEPFAKDDVVGVKLVNTGIDAESFQKLFDELKRQAPDGKIRMEDGSIHVDAAMTAKEVAIHEVNRLLTDGNFTGDYPGILETMLKINQTPGEMAGALEHLAEMLKTTGEHTNWVAQLQGAANRIRIAMTAAEVKGAALIDRVGSANPAPNKNVSAVEDWKRGGIDFAQSNLDMQIKRDGAGVPLPVSQQNLDNIRINGLVPVILDIRPASSVPTLMR